MKNTQNWAFRAIILGLSVIAGMQTNIALGACEPGRFNMPYVQFDADGKYAGICMPFARFRATTQQFAAASAHEGATRRSPARVVQVAPSKNTTSERESPSFLSALVLGHSVVHHRENIAEGPIESAKVLGRVVTHAATMAAVGDAVHYVRPACTKHTPDESWTTWGLRGVVDATAFITTAIATDIIVENTYDRATGFQRKQPANPWRIPFFRWTWEL